MIDTSTIDVSQLGENLGHDHCLLAGANSSSTGRVLPVIPREGRRTVAGGSFVQHPISEQAISYALKVLDTPLQQLCCHSVRTGGRGGSNSSMLAAGLSANSSIGVGCSSPIPLLLLSS